MKTFFRHAAEWQLVNSGQSPKPEILERCVFKHRKENVYLVADAYRGNDMRQAILDFLDAAAGRSFEKVTVQENSKVIEITAGGAANLVAYAGHDGLMDFQLPRVPRQRDAKHRDAIISPASVNLISRTR